MEKIHYIYLTFLITISLTFCVETEQNNVNEKVINEVLNEYNSKLDINFNKNSENLKKSINKYLNISFVMKKNIGNAVIRNKVKRKLKSAIQRVVKEKQLLNLNYTYVIFGKNKIYKDKFALVLDEINETFKKIKQMDNRSWNYLIIY